MGKTFKLRATPGGYNVLVNDKKVAHRRDFISAGAHALLLKYKADNQSDVDAGRARRKRVRDLTSLAHGGELMEGV